MKLNQIFSASLLTAALFFAACGTTPPNPDQPGKPGSEQTDTTKTDPGTSLTAISCAEAAALAEGTEVKVVGYVITPFSIADSKDGASKEQSAWLADDASASKGVIQAYYLTVTEEVAKGDKVECTGKIKYYKKGDDTTIEIVKPGTMTILEKGGSTTPTPSGDVTGAGTQDNPYTVADVKILNNANKGPHWVKGYIIGAIDGKALANATIGASTVETNFIIADAADENDPTAAIPVQLPAGFLRTSLNLNANPGNLKKEVMLYGTLEAYFSAPGVKNISKAYLDGKEVVEVIVDGGAKTIAEALAIIDALKEGETTKESYTIEGIVDEIGTKAEDLSKYGNVDFWLKDADGKKIKAFRTAAGPNKEKVTALPTAGATVKVYGPLMKYKDTKTNEIVPEIAYGYFVD